MMRTMQGRMVGGGNSIRMVRKRSGRLCFMGNLCPFGLFQPCFIAKNAYQTTGLGVVSVGKGYGTGRVDLWSG